MNEQISCPVDLVKINETQPRLVAAQVVVLSVIYVITHCWIIIAFLAIDFFLRAYKLGQYSLLGIVTKYFVQTFRIKGKQVNVAPKRFAAKLGFIFTIIILALYFLGDINASVYVTYLLIAAAILESVFEVCIGCIIYTYGLKVGLLKNN